MNLASYGFSFARVINLQEMAGLWLDQVTKMECAACAGSIEKAIKRLPGIEEATVAVLRNRAQVIYRPAFVQESAILESISDAGFDAEVVTDTQPGTALVSRFRIKGMTCTSCSNSIESALRKVPGVQAAVVALATEECEVHHDPALVSRAQILALIDDLGYDAEVLNSEIEEINRVRLRLEDVTDFQRVEDVLKSIDGVTSVVVDPVAATAIVSYDPDKAGPRDFIESGVSIALSRPSSLSFSSPSG